MNKHLTPQLQDLLEYRIMHGTTYMGIPALKNPMDAWVYQEIIHETRPQVIVEIGNRFGGSLLYLADRSPRVIGVDIDHSHLDPIVSADPRIVFITGDALLAFEVVERLVDGRSCLVIEDSAHTYDHTLSVLRTYSALVQPGGYLICEDGVMPEVAGALQQFAIERDDFVADRSREWPLTWNPNGYLRRVA